MTCRNPGCTRSADRGDGSAHAYCLDCADSLVKRGRLPLLLTALPGGATSPRGTTRSDGRPAPAVAASA